MEAWQKRESDGMSPSAGEFLSGFWAEDKLIPVSDSKPTVVHNLSFPAILLLKEQKEESVSECTLQP